MLERVSVSTNPEKEKAGAWIVSPRPRFNPDRLFTVCRFSPRSMLAAFRRFLNDGEKTVLLRFPNRRGEKITVGEKVSARRI